MTKREILVELRRIQKANNKLINYLSDGLEPRKAPQKHDIHFEEWWQLYPRKVAKAAARVKWMSRNLDAKADTMIKAVQHYANSVKCKDEKYTLHPSTYLNQERYNDAIPDAPKPLTTQQKLKLMSR